MDNFALLIFQNELLRQCRFAAKAWANIEYALGNLDVEAVWYSIQAFLIAFANVSKFFWLSRSGKKFAKDRSVYLRKRFEIEDGSPLRSREARNCLEHFDEWLDSWATSSKRKNFVDSNISSGPISNAISGIDEGDFLRNLDRKDMILSLFGKQYDLRQMRDAIADLEKKLRSMGA